MKIESAVANYVASSAEAQELAAKNGWKVVLPADNELQLDIDDSAGFQIYEKHRPMFGHFIEIEKVTEIPSKSGKYGRKHITLILKKTVTPIERILFQSLLGSDRMRELLSWIRIQQNDLNPTLFFEK